MQLKNFGHRSASKKAMETFNHVEDLLKFIGHGYTVLLAMDMLDIQSNDEVLLDSETDDDEDNTNRQVRKVCPQDCVSHLAGPSTDWCGRYHGLCGDT